MKRIIDELVCRGDEVIRLIESDINDFEKKYGKEKYGQRKSEAS